MEYRDTVRAILSEHFSKNGEFFTHEMLWEEWVEKCACDRSVDHLAILLAQPVNHAFKARALTVILAPSFHDTPFPWHKDKKPRNDDSYVCYVCNRILFVKMSNHPITLFLVDLLRLNLELILTRPPSFMNQHLLAVYTDTARDVIRQLPYDKSLSSVKALTKQLEIATNPSFTTPNSLIFNVFHLNPEWTELRKRMA